MLADGARILIRPIEPSDARQLEAAFDHLGAVSRYRRFLAPIDHLSDQQLAYLTHVDHIAHEALLAIDAATGEDVAVARFVRDPEDPSRAEVAIVVADHWQGRGIGGALADRLRDRARSVGVEWFTARMLIGNRGGRRLLDRVADEISENEDAGTIDIAARLKPPAHRSPEACSRVAHLSHRSNWLRAAVLGANDGIVSTASLVLGVAASGASGAAIVTAGVAGLAAGALSMAAGEYVSVSSQRDAERADLRLEAARASPRPAR